ncbi:MAG: tRNA lysidine(34) synthetase TilS, partial [Porphyromonas sp.]|nr:tRNA lysidine(34) synthetase TilS [Porphyromonas sp.]
MDLKSYVLERISGILPEGATIVVGLSGGLDSMVLTHLLDAAGYNLIIASCNFQLRGKESERDSDFVRHVCSERWPNHRFFYMVFNTQKVAKEKGISIEMAARELRHSWLKELKETYGAEAIALGHHQTDQVETILLNLIRGTGIRGLLGMEEWRDPLLRPLLGVKKEDLRAYAKINSIPSIEDSSNQKPIYKRNKVRLELLPLLKEFNPSIEDTLFKSVDYWREEHLAFQKAYSEFAKVAITRSGQRLDMHKLVVSTSPAAFLHEYFSDYNFSSEVIADILREPMVSGRRFLNRDMSYEAELFRGALYLSPMDVEKDFKITIPKVDGSWSVGKGTISASFLNVEDVGAYDKGCLYLDADTIPNTLLLRTVDAKDSFSPMGMRGRKDAMDF